MKDIVVEISVRIIKDVEEWIGVIGKIGNGLVELGVR